MPNILQPASGGGAEAANAGGASQLPYGKPGGEILIRREEARALTVLETDEGHDNYHRASKESGLTVDQIRKLWRRAEKARNSGYTLKGANITLKPKNYEPDGAGLLSDDDHDKSKTVGKPKKGAPAKGTATVATSPTRESVPVYPDPTSDPDCRSCVHLRECSATGMCEACRAKRAKKRLAEAIKRKKAKAPCGRTMSY